MRILCQNSQHPNDSDNEGKATAMPESHVKEEIFIESDSDEDDVDKATTLPETIFIDSDSDEDDVDKATKLPETIFIDSDSDEDDVEKAAKLPETIFTDRDSDEDDVEKVPTLPETIFTDSDSDEDDVEKDYEKCGPLPEIDQIKNRKLIPCPRILALENKLYELFMRNMRAVWCITLDGRAVNCTIGCNLEHHDDWRVKLNWFGSLITIILGTYNKTVNKLIDEIVDENKSLNKAYIIVHPTQIWINRMKNICKSENTLPIAIFLPLIHLKDVDEKDILQEEVYKILYDNPGDVCGLLSDYNGNGFVDRFIKMRSSYLKFETEFEKIMDIIEDGKAGLLLFKKMDIISLHPKSSTRHIISRCNINDIPYLFVTSMESMKNELKELKLVLPSEDLMYLCILQRKTLSVDDSLFFEGINKWNKKHLKTIINDVYHIQTEISFYQKGRHEKWPALDMLDSFNPPIMDVQLAGNKQDNEEIEENK